MPAYPTGINIMENYQIRDFIEVLTPIAMMPQETRIKSAAIIKLTELINAIDLTKNDK